MSHFNINIPSTPTSPKLPLSLHIPAKMFINFLSSSQVLNVRSASVSLICAHNTVFCRAKVWNSSLRYFLNAPVTSFLLGPNVPSSRFVFSQQNGRQRFKMRNVLRRETARELRRLQRIRGCMSHVAALVRQILWEGTIPGIAGSLAAALQQLGFNIPLTHGNRNVLPRGRRAFLLHENFRSIRSNISVCSCWKGIN
jgi:hypothetical protein